MKSVVIFALVICLAIVPYKIINLEKEIFHDPDVFRNVSELISSKGYVVEEHNVRTTDGFILSLQRIPHGRSNYSRKEKKKVAFLLYGIFCSSAHWVINFPHQSLGFILADAGYDVWLGNNRGNIYSRQHVNYTPDQDEFWDYSLDELAQYDVPAMIDYVLNTTGQEELYYIGHSLGSASAVAFLSENPAYTKIKLLIALAPAVRVDNMETFVSYLCPVIYEFQILAKFLGVREFFPIGIVQNLRKMIWETAVRFIWKETLFLVSGTDRFQLNETRVSVYSSHTPAGSSVRNFAHIIQNVKSKAFTKYDFGEVVNMEKYNQTTPPEYDVSRIKTPVAIVWSQNDKAVEPRDVESFQRQLRSMVSSYRVPFDHFNHLDYMFAVDAPKLLHHHILSVLAEY